MSEASVPYTTEAPDPTAQPADGATPLYYTCEEFAALTRTNPDTVRNKCALGLLPLAWSGKPYRICAWAVEQPAAVREHDARLVAQISAAVRRELRAEVLEALGEAFGTAATRARMGGTE